MKKLYASIAVLAVATFFFTGFAACQDKSKDDKKKADQLASKIRETGLKYTTTVDSFNGIVTVKVGTKFETLVMAPGESLKVPKDAPPEKGIVTWKSVTQFENDMMIADNPNDQRVRWFVENIQTDRVNQTLKALLVKFKKDWEDNNPGRDAPNKLSFYMPGNNDTERYDAIGNLIDQIVTDFGMTNEAPFTRVAWKAKFTTGNEQLYKADLRDLANKEGLLPYYTTIESLISSSSSSKLGG